MTASMAGTGTCLAAKGFDISLAALKRQDPYINNIVDVASQVALYTFSNRANEWEKTDVEGTLFVYTRLASPRHGFTIMNRLSMDNLTEPITKDLDFQLQDPFLLYRNARLSIYGIWFYDKEDCLRIAELMKDLTRQEQVLARRDEDVSPRVVRTEDSKGVDILLMLTKARNEYDKGKPYSEPKEIASSSVIYGNPHLIKPIPVKPLERPHGAQQGLQDSEGEPRHLSLAALFGAQSQLTDVSPQAGSRGGRPAGPRPGVARSLSYEEPARPGAGGAVVSGSPPQHCPAIQKLMSAQRGPAELLHPVSESPENRLCENGVPQPAHHCQGGDPLHRLFQNAPASPSCCAHPPHPLQQPPPPLHGQPGLGVGLPLPHHPNAKPLFFSPAKPQGTGIISPHELLQRLQLVQQEQSLSTESVRPTLAPRFQDPAAQPRPQAPPTLQPHPQAPPTLQPHSQPPPVFQPHSQPPPVFQPHSQPPPVFQPHSQPPPVFQPRPQAPPTLQTHPQGPPTLQPHPQAPPTLQPRPQAPPTLQPHLQAPPSLQPHPQPLPAFQPRPQAPPTMQAHSQAPPTLQPHSQAPPTPQAHPKSLSAGHLDGWIDKSSGPVASEVPNPLFQGISPQRVPVSTPSTVLMSPMVFAQSKSAKAGIHCSSAPVSPMLPQALEDPRTLTKSQLQATMLHLIQTDAAFLDTIYKAYIGSFSKDMGSKKL